MALEKVGVRATIEGLNAFNSGMRKMGRGVEAYGKEALTASKRTEILTGALKKTGIALTATAAASGALLFSSVKLAARVETLGVVTATLGRNVDKTEKEIRDLEQAITAEGITLRVARKAIALMIQSNVDLARATDLARLAQDAAVIAGINSSEAFERLIFVITSGNVRMARTLGLQVSFAQGMEKMAASIGKTQAELTPLERIQARTNEVMAAGTNIAGAYGAAMETAGKKVTSLDRLIEESKRTLGEAWLPTYAKVIDFITATLNVWLELGQVQKDLVSSTLGVVTAFVGLLGVAALIGAQLPAAIAGFSSLASALGIVTVVGFSATAVLGIVVAAIVAVGVAFIMIIKTINRVRLGFKQINDAVKEQEKRMFKTADTFEDYRKEMVRVGKVTKQVVGTQKELDGQLKRGEITTRQYNKAIVIASEGLFESELVTRELTEGTSDLARSVARSDEIMLRYARGIDDVKKSEEELAAEQEGLIGQLDALKLTINTDITPQFEDFKTKVDDLTTQIEGLESKKYLTKAQKEQLEDLRLELADTRDAWDKTTANLIFNLAEQRLAIEGFTKEEIEALALLAGPQGLGLVDEAGAALIEIIFELGDALDQEGDQIDLFRDSLGDVSDVMNDSTLDADGLADAIRNIPDRSVTVTTTFVTRGGPSLPGPGPGGLTAAQLAAAQASAAAKARAEEAARRILTGGRLQHGGFAQAGRAFMVGEAGQEIFVPRQSGTVLSNRFVGAITTLVAALKSAPALMAAPMTPVSAGSVTNNEFNMNINTNAPSEPIIADFRTLQSMANAT